MSEQTEVINSKNSYNWLDKLIKLVPLGGVFLIFCGGITLITYYHQFGISITNYLSLDEYVSLIFIDILNYLSILILGILYYNIFISFTLKLITGRVILIFTLAWILLNFLLLCFQFENNSVLLITTRNNIFILLIALFTYLKLKNIQNSFLIVLAATFLVFSIFQGFIKAEKLYEFPQEFIVEIQIEDLSKIVTNDNFVYLGQSENFFFFYNLELEISIIHTKKDVQFIRILKSKSRD